MDVISNFAARFERNREEELSIEEYLAECKRNPLAYATAAERILKAIGEPQMVDTRNDTRLSRLFANKLIKIYPAFAEFYVSSLNRMEASVYNLRQTRRFISRTMDAINIVATSRTG